MKPIYDAWLIQIEITNACHLRCANCSRAVPHIAEPYFMDMDYLEEALKSLKDWPRGVGCMGGEPTLHPEFEKVCELYQRYVGYGRSGLWTSGGPKYDEYEPLIRQTFRILLYNDHSEPGYHQPVMVACDEMIADEELKNKLIDNCWLQDKWSPAINPKGAFFCEQAAVFDLIFDGPGGYELTDDWWKKDDKDFKDQVDRYCGPYCSACIPLPHEKNNVGYDVVSPKNYERLKQIESPWLKQGKVKQGVLMGLQRDDIRDVLSKYSYAPWEYLGDSEIRDKKGGIKGGYAKRRSHNVLS